ncbi:hypothetical protein EKO27_g10678 [Xylaria grammica]|uniref:Uncharacterized protein n=1 Tax=Xylaria grammica TaxID=363999 RepID=A0A439CQK1_9PEZI|nr:hypothetical protein EKO27_g10678 [Xylaria grammica]
MYYVMTPKSSCTRKSQSSKFHTFEVLIALINDQHPGLHTLLFGKLAYWKDLAPLQPCPEPYPLAKVLLTYEKFKSFCDANNQPCPLDEPSAHTPADWGRTLMEFCSDLKWGVVPLTNLAQTFTKYSVIVLRSEQLELLSGSDVTLAEQCYITLNIAEEIIHELAHAISHSRVAVTFPPTSTRGYQYDEPFIDFSPIAEMGFDITQRIFGGIGLRLGHSKTAPYLPILLAKPQLLEMPLRRDEKLSNRSTPHHLATENNERRVE